MLDEKLYGTFAPPERFTLLLEAMARDDDAEVERLRDTCPRASYTRADAAFDERVRLSLEMLMAVCIDLRATSAKLFTIEWSKEVLRHFTPLHHITATVAFVEGVRCARGLVQSPFFNSDEKCDDEAVPPAVEGEAERMMAVEERSERATVELLEVFDGAAEAVAQQLVDTWAAFDGFCRGRTGADAATVFRAWQMPLLGDVQAMLKLHPDVKPDAENVKVSRRLLDLTWDRRFGGHGNE